MSGYPFMKIYVEILDDVKMAELTDAQKWRFIQLILLAGECDAGGALVTGESRMTLSQVSWRLRCDKNELEKDIQKMIELGLIYDDEAIAIAKFEDRQGPSQDEKRAIWRERQRKRRERLKKDEIVTEDSRRTHGGLTLKEKEEEKEEELINGDGKKPSPKRNQSPEEKAYYDLQARFIDFTGLPKPEPKTTGDFKEFNTLWKSPGKSILSWVDYDINKAGILIEEAVNQMTKDKLTIANFKSIVKVASDCYRSRNNGRS